MSDDTEKTNENLPAVREPRANIAAGGTVKSFIPQTLDEAWRFAGIVVKGGFTPPGLETPEKVLTAIVYGAELGLTPFQSVRNVAVINNRPAVWGDAVMALVKASGRCEYVVETITGEGDAMEAVCTVKRRQEPEQSRTFSVADAKTARLWGKAGPWQQYPKRMLQLRARSFALRDIFADVLGGIEIAEEVRDREEANEPPAIAASDVIEGQATEVAPAPNRRKKKTSSGSGRSEQAYSGGDVVPAQDGEPPAATDDAGEPPAAEEDAAVEDAVVVTRSSSEVLAEFETDTAAAGTLEDLEEVWSQYEDMLQGYGRGVVTEAQAIYERREAALQEAKAKAAAAEAPVEEKLSPEDEKTAYQHGWNAYKDGVLREEITHPNPLMLAKAQEGWDDSQKKKRERLAAAKTPAPAVEEPPPASEGLAQADTAPPSGLAQAKPAPSRDTLLQKAKLKGEMAFEAGMARKALPPEWRTEENSDLAEQWYAGWDEAKAAGGQ